MKPFSLYAPLTPFVVTQAWGIPNAIYNQFGFGRHNGSDCRAKEGQPIYQPIDAVAIKIGWESTGAGHYLVMRTTEEYLFPDGKTTYAELSYFHLSRPSDVLIGRSYKAGKIIGLAGNSGFSTASHLHWRLRRVKLVGGRYIYIDPNDAQQSIDAVPYLNGKNASEIVNGVFQHTFLRDLVYGESSDEISALQTALQILGFLPATEGITRYYGRITQGAVRAFQDKYQVATLWERMWLNGTKCGPASRAKLNELFSK